MIIGVGVDLVDLARFKQKLADTPKLIERLFSVSEADVPRPETLAGRFAAKEAVVKALAGSAGFGYHDILISGGQGAAPTVTLLGAAKQQADARGVTGIHLSISHDAGAAIAFVVLEG